MGTLLHLEPRPGEDQHRGGGGREGLRRRYRSIARRVFAPAKQAQSQALILLLIATAPDLNRLTTNEDLGWTLYLTANELAKGILVFKLIPWTYLRWGSLLWFATQALDEATRRNIWTEDRGPLEYIAFVVLCAITWYLHKKNA